MTRMTRAAFNVGAALLGLLVAALIAAAILLARGSNPIFALSQMVDYGSQRPSIVAIINSATTYYLAAIAVAIGFRMNLFNIGVDGQYRLAAMLAAAFGGSVALPNGVRQIATVAVAMLVGALWAGVAAVLKAARGVSEVISTIMLNFVATGIVAYLLTANRLGYQAPGSNNIGTKPIPPSGQIVGLDLIPGAGRRVYGLIVLAVLVGLAYQLVISRTRFGFNLRATGRSETAAAASGVNVKRMIIITMLISGAIAGLVGMPNLLGESHQYSLNFPSGLGFTGIAIALLGRNHPVGIAFGALLWAFLDQSALILDIYSIPKEIVQILQAAVVLSVVVTYELVRRFALMRQQQRVGRQLSGAPDGPSSPQEVPA